MKTALLAFCFLASCCACAQYEAHILGDGYATGIGGGKIVGRTAQFDGGLALMWDLNTFNRVILNPPGSAWAQAEAAGGKLQVGRARIGNRDHAIAWSGSPTGYVDLDDTRFLGTLAHATDGMQVVGEGYRPGINNHALLWNGTTLIDLAPPDFRLSVAYGVHNGKQVGLLFNGGPNRAALWSGTAASLVDLTPAGAINAQARGIHGNEQVGWVDGHAAMWHGTSASFLDLDPGTGIGSTALATNGIQQVGYLGAGQRSRPCVWSGSAASIIDLYQFVPSNYHDLEANGIDEFGNIVGFGYDDFGPKAILWKPVPEPSSLFVIGGGLFLLLCARRRKVSQ